MNERSQLKLHEPVMSADELPGQLERRGRAWLLWSFLLCPCHLPVTLGVVGTLLAGTWFGILVREHPWIAGGVFTVLWLLGTGYGLRLVRQAEKAGGSCRIR